MHVEKFIRSDLPAFAVFASLLEMTVSDIAQGMIDGNCTPEGAMLPPSYLMTETDAARWAATSESLAWLKKESYSKLCDEMGLHPEEVIREAKRRWRQGSAMRDGTVRVPAAKRGECGRMLWQKLRERGPLTAMDLAREVGMSWKNTMRRIGWLVSAGLVEETSEKEKKGRYWSPKWRALDDKGKREEAAA